MEQNLKGKVCLIIGGTKGMGFEAAKALYGLGARVVICGRNTKRAKIAARSIDSDFLNVLYFRCNIDKFTDIKRVVLAITHKWQRVDILIITAGIFGPFGTFESVPFNEHKETINTNILGTMACCYEVIKIMKKQKSGKIILFSGAGIGNEMPLDNASSYFVSKGALVFFAEVLAEELSPFNVSINAILPGRILTESTRSIIGMPKKRIGKVLYEATKELKKGGQPAELVVKLITFLCLSYSKKLTGKLISVKWDRLATLASDLPAWMYTLRRIEGKVYTKLK